MQITFQSAESTFTKTAKGGYSNLNVSFIDERGQNKSWKLVSFANPKVFDTLKSATAGQVYNIDTTVDEKGYTKWQAATLVEGAVPAVASSSASKPAAVSNYETRDERNVRQRLIVRQSCLAQAIASLEEKSDTTIVLALAEQYVAWVFEAPGLMDEPSDS